MSVSPPRRERGARSSVMLLRFVPAGSSANLARFARSVASDRPIDARSRSIDFSSTEIVGGGAGIDCPFGGVLGVPFVPAFTGGVDEWAGFAGSGGAAGAVAGAGAGIEGNFGGPGTFTVAFVAAPGRGGGTALAGRDKLGRGGGLGKPVSGRGARVGGRADGVPFAPTGAGTLLPAAFSAVGALGGAGGSLGGMGRVSPKRIKRQLQCSSSLPVREEF